VKGILREMDALPIEQRCSVLEGIRRLLEPEIPASFKEGMQQRLGKSRFCPQFPTKIRD
jgi:hypothetical protein